MYLSIVSSPKNKFIRITKDENFSHDKHYLTNTPAIADSVCSYDLDQLDEAWLKQFNGERSMCGLPPVNEEQFERVVEELEVRLILYYIVSIKIIQFNFIDSVS